MQLVNCFWKTLVVLKRTFKCFTALVRKRTDCSQVELFYSCCWLVSADCLGNEAGLTAPDVSAVCWWLDVRWRVDVGQVVKNGCGVTICW